MSLLNKIIFGDVQGKVLSLQDFEFLKVISENEGVGLTTLARLTGLSLYEVLLISHKLSTKKLSGNNQPLLVSLRTTLKRREKCFALTREGEAFIRQFLNEPSIMH